MWPLAQALRWVVLDLVICVHSWLDELVHSAFAGTPAIFLRLSGYSWNYAVTVARGAYLIKHVATELN